VLKKLGPMLSRWHRKIPPISRSLASSPLVQFFLCHRDSIGPNFFSTPVSGKVMNGGKMNQQHRLNVTATINHQNPIMDSIAWEGAIIIYRMAIMNEN